MELIIACLVFSVIILTIVLISGKSKSAYSFVIAGRSVSSFRIAASLSSGFRDGAGIAAWVVFIYYFNIGAIWLFVGMALSLIFLSILSQKIRLMVEDTDIYSLNQYCSRFIGNKTGTITVLLLGTTAILVSSAQLHVAGNVLAALFDVSSLFGILFISITVGLYLVIGGFKSVILTDLFEWLTLFVIFLVPFLINEKGVQITINWNSISSPGNLIYSLVPLVFLIIATGGDVWQRIFSARNSRTARNGLLLTAPFYLILSVGVILFGLSVKAALPDVPAGKAFLLLFNSEIYSGSLLAVLGLFTVAAITSTVDTQTFVFSSAIVTSKGSQINTNIEESKDKITLLRKVIISFLCLISIISYLIGDIVIFLFSSYSISTILFPVLILIVYRGSELTSSERFDKNISYVLLFSIFIYFFLWIIGLYSNLAFTLVAPTISTIGLISVYFLSKWKSEL